MFYSTLEHKNANQSSPCHHSPSVGELSHDTFSSIANLARVHFDVPRTKYLLLVSLFEMKKILFSNF
jgi:hypothetical protein